MLANVGEVYDRVAGLYSKVRGFHVNYRLWLGVYGAVEDRASRLCAA